MNNKISKTFFSGLVYLAMITAPVQGIQIFYESFESPVVGSAQSGTDPAGWLDLSTGGNGVTRAGLGYLTGTAYTNYTGDQAAWLNVYNSDPILVTTTNILNTNLVAGLRYTLRFNAAGYRDYVVYADLLAGTNVVLTTYVYMSSDTSNFSNKVASGSAVFLPGDPGVGEALSIRLRVTGGAWDQNSYVDNLSLDAVDTSGDVTPPSPGTTLWAATPTQDVHNAITMQAATATDSNLVQYLFTNTVNGHVSGWQDSPIWTDTGLLPGSLYTYRVKARDKSVNFNETSWSVPMSAIADPHIVLYESFEKPVVPFDQTGWTTPPGYTPEGWTGTSASTRKSGAATTTSYGNQLADASYTGGRTGKRIEANAMQQVLGADYTYTLRFAAGNVLAYSGVQFTAEILAGTTVITNLIAETGTDDMSETFALAFVPDKHHPQLGEELRVLFYHSDGGQWQSTAIFDNIILKAVPPPPAGTVLIVR